MRRACLRRYLIGLRPVLSLLLLLVVMMTSLAVFDEYQRYGTVLDGSVRMKTPPLERFPSKHDSTRFCAKLNLTFTLDETCQHTPFLDLSLIHI